MIRDGRAFHEVKSKNGDLFLGSEALPGSLGHWETTARNRTLFERAVRPTPTEARQVQKCSRSQSGGLDGLW
jgi:hypothetical protein